MGVIQDKDNTVSTLEQLIGWKIGISVLKLKCNYLGKEGEQEGSRGVWRSLEIMHLLEERCCCGGSNEALIPN